MCVFIPVVQGVRVCVCVCVVVVVVVSSSRECILPDRGGMASYHVAGSMQSFTSDQVVELGSILAGAKCLQTKVIDRNSHTMPVGNLFALDVS